ncbi:unnamed protein product [Brachionus calyciflorus]|uniref:Homeobox domain-containing protein n=1 Tax=Brachionus calyciflorus TaxID=104777 RepID=A0A814H2C9_9BILA|nr:unnamed protein product [Brachionus calyciflorus]
MPKNSFLIEDILDSNSKQGFKKRALSNNQSDCAKSSPSLSPASFISTSSSDDFMPSNDCDLLKQQYLKQALPSLLLNQYLNPMMNHYPKTDESLYLLTNYYSQLLNRNIGCFDNEQKVKRVKVEEEKSIKNFNEVENVSPLDALLNLANNINKTNLTQNETKIIKTEVSDVKKQLNSSNSSFDGSVNEPLVKMTNSKTSQSLNAMKRKRKNRTAFTANQIFELEKRFSTQKYLSPHDRDRIAYELQLTTAQVITWFQNRRAKQKRDIEELKNDVNAAKSLRVVDPDLDVDKIVKSAAGSLCEDRIKSEEEDDEDLDVEESDDDQDDNSSNLSNSIASNQNYDDSISNSSGINK